MITAQNLRYLYKIQKKKIIYSLAKFTLNATIMRNSVKMTYGI